MKAHFQNHREIVSRVCIQGLLELSSTCHLGGADASAASDQPLLRNSEGRPYLPGTTLTGLLRSALEEVDCAASVALFGASWRNAQGKQARLLMNDAAVAASGTVSTEFRDGVRIDPASGVAADKKKFDLELLPVGTRFRLCLELDLHGNREYDEVLLRGLLLLLHALEEGRIKLGARTRRGFGETQIVADPAGNRWHIEEYPVATEEGLQAWLGRGLDGLPADWPAVQPIPCQDAAALARHWKFALPAFPAIPAFEVRLHLMQAGSLLVASEGHDPEEPDRSHLQRLRLGNGGDRFEPVLPATSLAGALRNRCLRIAQTLSRRRNGKARELVNWMFGPEEIKKDERAWSSRVEIREVPIRAGRSLRHTRVRIDPWTGGAVERLLFTEDAYYGGSVTIDVRLLEGSPEDESMGPARALLMLAVRDLASGDLSLGAEGGVGRGTWRPIAGRSFARTTAPRAELSLEGDGAVRCEPADAFDEDFAALRRKLTPCAP